MGYKYIVFLLLALMLVVPVMAGDLSLEEPKQVDKSEILDSSYIVSEEKVVFKDLVQTKPIVWIDKKVGDVYHVDSLKTFVVNESVTLEFFYDIQPDSIAHYTHSGKFDRYFFPTQWNWTPNCIKEDVCSGGYVTMEVQNIEEGIGSSTFPIGVTGPTWATQGQYYGEFDGVSSVIDGEIENPINASYSFWVKQDTPSGTRNFNVGYFYIYVDSNGLSSISYRNATSYYNSLKSTTSCNDTWVHIIFTGFFDGTNMNFSIFSNGDFERNFVNLGIILQSTDLEIGTSDSINYFNGSIDEVLVYNRTLDQSEITALYNNYSVTSTGINRTGTPSTSGLVLDINFDDYSVADNSGSGNHGTNTNVSFGIVENVLRTLTPTTDYTLGATTGLFTIVNTDYSWSWLNVSWSYLDELKEAQDYAVSLDAMESLGELGSWFSSIIIISIAGGILFLIYFAFGKPKNESSFNY